MIIRNALLLCVGILLFNQIALAGQVTASVFDKSHNNDQRAVVSFHFENEPLAEVLQELARKVDVGISYKTVILPSKLVTYEAEEASIYRVLGDILEGTGLYATLSDDRKVILIKKEPITPIIQQETITGTVTDANTGITLPGVNIGVKGTTTGTATDSNGQYKLTVESLQDTLVFSFVGYQTQEVPIDGRTTINTTLEQETLGLEGLVVTALGQKRQERSLGYSSQAVTSDDINKVPETNVINSLQGNIAGVDITGSTGNVGGSSRIVLRGASSLSGDNQPLFIIDGIYIDNSNYDGAGASGWTSSEVDYGNAAMDINPEDIESINVLKGPNAAALYGSRAANGAIVIETKSGKGGKGVGIDISSSTQFQSILEFPEYQNEFGQGKIDANGVPRFEYVDGKGGGVFDAVGESWGPRLDDGLMIPQWFSNGEPVPWVSHPGNTRSFFQRGSELKNSVSLSKSYERTNFRLSATNSQNTGIVPNAQMKKTNFLFNGGIDLTDKLHAEGRVSYISLNAQNRAEQGYNWNNVMFTIGQWTGRQIDMDMLRDYKDEDGNMRNWSNIHENPYWIQYENTNSQDRDRIMSSINITYDINNWISLDGFTGNDWYIDNREARYAKGGHRTPDGEYIESSRYVNDWSSRLIIRADRDMSQDISINGMIGVENLQNKYRFNRGHAEKLSLPNLYTLENAAVRPTLTDYQSKKEVNSVFGSATIGYKEYAYLDVTGRNDWSSTLPMDNNSYFYPSLSLSFILTDAFSFFPDWFTFGKLRGGWTKVGSDTDPYQLEARYISGSPIGNIATYTVDNTISNKTLQPEQTESFELGTELRFANNRLNLDATYYTSSTTDQIIPVQVSRASGYQSQVINAGEIKNHGIEIMLSGTPVESSSFTWDVNLNYTRNRNEVVELVPGLESFVIGGRGASVEARPGDAFGTLYGTGYLRDENENIIVDDRGIPIVDNTVRGFGTYAPDWSGSINNQFTYKNWAFSFLIDTKQGGVIHSDGYRWGMYSGVLKETLKGRIEPFVFNGSRYADGAVKQDGTPNDIPIDMSTVYPYYRHFSNITESTIFDASFIKLREARIAFSVPSKLLQKFSITRVDIALIGRNLWIIDKKVPHIDPETALNAGNMQGIESNQIPPVRSYGFNINISF